MSSFSLDLGSVFLSVISLTIAVVLGTIASLPTDDF